MLGLVVVVVVVVLQYAFPQKCAAGFGMNYSLKWRFQEKEVD
jgi:hypothetical protein